MNNWVIHLLSQLPAWYIYLITLPSLFLKCQTMPAVQHNQPWWKDTSVCSFCLTLLTYIYIFFFFKWECFEEEKSGVRSCSHHNWTHLTQMCIHSDSFCTVASRSILFITVDIHWSAAQVFDLGLNLGNCSGWLGGIKVETGWQWVQWLTVSVSQCVWLSDREIFGQPLLIRCIRSI